MAQRQRGGGSRKYGRNKTKCEHYRNHVGKPNGPGQPGQKAGHGKPRRTKEAHSA